MQGVETENTGRRGFLWIIRKASQLDLFGRPAGEGKRPKGRQNHGMVGQIHLPTGRPPGGGWQPIPASKHGGFRRRRGTKWEYWYPDGQHGTHETPREPTHGHAHPTTANGDGASVDYARAGGKQLRDLAEGGDKAAEAEMVRRREKRAADGKAPVGEVKRPVAGPEAKVEAEAVAEPEPTPVVAPAAAPAADPEPEPEQPEAADDPSDEAVAQAVEAVKVEAIKQIDHAADNPVKHEEVGEHVWGSRKDTAYSTGAPAPVAGSAKKKDIFVDFTIHDHVAKGGTIGGWHLKQWVAGMIAAKSEKGLDDAYAEGCRVVSKTLDKCLTVSDVETAVKELADWGVAYRARDVAKPDGDYIDGGLSWKNGWGTRRMWQERTSGLQKASLGKRFLGVIFGQSRGYFDAKGMAAAMERKGVDAESYIKAHARTRGFAISDTRTVKTPKRKGGRDVPGVSSGAIDGAAVAAHFGGLANLQYGDWMSHADRDRHLRGAAGALSDLADVLGISDASISLGGKLSIGFGARGKSAASAHYEAGRKIINLTKFRGGGSLAHEWGHFMDNMVNGGKGFASLEGSRSLALAVPERTAAAMAELKRGIASSEFAKDAKALDEKKKTAYWSADHEMFARVFESHTSDALSKSGRANTYLVHGTRGEGHMTGVKRQVSAPLSPEEKAAHRERIDAAKKAAEETLAREAAKVAPRSKPSATFWGLSDAAVQKVVRRSPEAKAAMDAYWVARRAEQSAAAQKAKAAGEREAQPYPSGEEREVLTGLMGKFIDAARADGLLGKMMKAFLDGGRPSTGFAALIRKAVGQ